MLTFWEARNVIAPYGVLPWIVDWYIDLIIVSVNFRSYGEIKLQFYCISQLDFQVALALCQRKIYCNKIFWFSYFIELLLFCNTLSIISACMHSFDSKKPDIFWSFTTVFTYLASFLSFEIMVVLQITHNLHLQKRNNAISIFSHLCIFFFSRKAFDRKCFEEIISLVHILDIFHIPDIVQLISFIYLCYWFYPKLSNSSWYI